MRFSVTIAPELHRDLTKLASEDFRSLNSLVNKILSVYVKENPPKPTTRVD